MVRRLFGKMMWLGRATSALVGLVVLFALAIGAANSALAHTNVDTKLFHLGHNNPVAALSKLSGNLTSAVLQVTNQSTANTTQNATAIGATNYSPSSPAMRAANARGGPALGLNVTCGGSPSTCFKPPPMTVNSDTKVVSLNSDKLDGQDSTDFAPKAVEAWREVGAANEPEFLNFWTNFGGGYSTAAFYKDPWGVVHLKGLIKGGPVPQDGSLIFQLPCGYGTGMNEVHSVLSNDAAGRVTIYSWTGCGNGQFSAFVMAAPPSNSAWISLDGITFRAAGS